MPKRHTQARCAVLVICGLVTAIVTACSSSSVGGAGTGGSASGQTPITIAFSYLENVEYGGFYLADDRGYYKAANIKPVFQGGGPNAPAPELLLSSGKAQIAVEANPIRLYQYLAKNPDIVIVGVDFQTSPNGLLSLSKRPVTNVDQLHGARILAGPAAKPAVETLMRINHISDSKFVPGGTDVGPLLAGQGDALVAFSTSQPITLEQQYHMTEGKDFQFVPYSDLNYYLYSDLILVSREFLQQHRAEVVAFMKATVQGWSDYVKDPDPAAKLAVSKYGATLGLNLAQQQAEARAQVPLVQPTTGGGLLQLNAQFIQDKMYPSLEAGGLTGLPPVTSVIDTSVLSAAP